MPSKDVRSEILSNDRVVGEYYRLCLKTGWSKFDPGQFVMLRIPDKSVFVRRPFSIFRSRGFDSIEIIYKVVGRGTERLSRMVSGAKVDVLGPLGRGFFAGGGLGEAILISGGFGIAPFVELARVLSVRNIKTALYHGGKTSGDILFLDEFKGLGVECRIATEDGSIGYGGSVTELLAMNISKGDHKITTTYNTMLYACGPKGMLERIADISKKNSMPAQISYETYMGCGLGVCLGCVMETKNGLKRVCREGPVFDVEEIRM